MSRGVAYLVCTLIALAAVPLCARVVMPNPFYGFRTAETLQNEVLWLRVNCFFGWALIVAAAISAVAIRFGESLLRGYLFAPIVIGVLAAIGATAFYASKLQ